MNCARILVVEDDRSVIELVRLNLEAAGYEVIPVKDGQEALDAARRFTPSCILLDLMLPTLDGLEVCRRLREDRQTALIPVLMLSARDRPSDKVNGFRTGADDYLSKPFNMEELLARVHALLHRTRHYLAASPLTGLPGTCSIQAETRRRIAQGGEFAFLYLDMDRFKAYNDRRGFEEGNRVIRFLAEAIADRLPDEGFAGHIGGDDFVVLIGTSQADDFTRRLIEGFDRGMALLDGGVVGDRLVPPLEGAPLRRITLSVSGVLSGDPALDDYARYAERAARIKLLVKNRGYNGRSAYLIEQGHRLPVFTGGF